MFEKLSQMAEQAATSVSRRQFLGHFGRAAALATAAGALLAQTVHAGGGKVTCPDFSVSECAGRPVGHRCSGGKTRCTLINGLCICCPLSGCM
jgi:hypothetical protein